MRVQLHNHRVFSTVYVYQRSVNPNLDRAAIACILINNLVHESADSILFEARYKQDLTLITKMERAARDRSEEARALNRRRFFTLETAGMVDV